LKYLAVQKGLFNQLAQFSAPPVFGCVGGFELMLSLNSSLPMMLLMGYTLWHDPDPAN
jgi:hypothetical protein